jgi:hypothetical protein
VVCNAPTGLTATNITASGATLSWTAVSGATSYRVEFKTNASATWTLFNAANATTTATLTGLTSATLYDYRVSTNCTGGSSSATAAQFTTLTAPACLNAFEPNETTTAAATITSGSINSAAISTSTDVDFYRITTTATSNIVYNLVGPAGVDYDLQILNSAGVQVGSVATTSSTETITLNNQAAGTYFIRVFGFNGANSTTCYTIQATATSTSCVSSKDTSTNNTTAGAATIAFNTDIRGLINVGSDVDHYRFVISRAGTITLTLTTLPANYHLRLVSSTGTVLVTSNRSGTSNETISYTAAVGTYFARVYPTNTSTFNATSCYTLRVALGTAARPADYVTIDKSKPTMQIVPNPVHDRVNVQLSGFDGNAEISVFNMNGVQLMKRKATIGNTPFDFSGLASGVYYIQVSQGKAILSRSKFIKQ